MNKNHCKQENIRLGTHGEDYGSWMSNPVFYIIGGIMEQVHRVVLSHLDYDGEGKILEVGCGSGALTIRSALTWPKAKVIGVDHWGAVYNYSKALCEKNAAREGVASRCVFQHGDAKQLDFPDESFDVVISNYVYHNVMGADMQKLLLESLRVLKKGGVFALNDDMKPKMYGDMEGFAQKLRDMGYEEVNLNLGCPSPTVTSRNRGSGFLALPRELDRFLEEIFGSCPMTVSIKTRIGVEDEEEWPQLLEIFEKYPLEELIIHPRLKTDQYKKNTIHWEAFKKAEESSRHSLCYNGDIVSKDDYEKVVQRFPGTEKIMIGRGILKKPWLAEEISNGDKKDSSRYKEELFEFHEELLKGYMDYMSGDRNTLYKMKELWAYLGTSFTNPERYMKKIRKSQHISEYRIWVGNLFREQDLIW